LHIDADDRAEPSPGGRATFEILPLRSEKKLSRPLVVSA
jgi:hypothetical protein